MHLSGGFPITNITQSRDQSLGGKKRDKEQKSFVLCVLQSCLNMEYTSHCSMIKVKLQCKVQEAGSSLGSCRLLAKAHIVRLMQKNRITMGVLSLYDRLD